jgi:hypothetical protein
MQEKRAQEGMKKVKMRLRKVQGWMKDMMRARKVAYG